MAVSVSNSHVVKKIFPTLGWMVVLVTILGLFTMGLFSPQNDNNQNGASTNSSPSLFLMENEEMEWYNIRKYTSNGFVAVVPEFDGEVVDYVQEDEVEALIRDVEGAYHVLYRVEGGDWQSVATTSTEKTTLTLSADGRALAYAERVDVERPPLDMLSWEIQLFVRDTKQLVSIAPGYAPYFVPLPNGPEDWEGLFFSTPYGVGVYDSVSNEVVYSSAVTTSSSEFPIIFSKDSKHLSVYSPNNNEQTIFSILQYIPLRVSVVTTTQQLRGATFVDSTFIGIPPGESQLFLVDFLKKKRGFVENIEIETDSIVTIIE